MKDCNNNNNNNNNNAEWKSADEVHNSNSFVKQLLVIRWKQAFI